MVVNNLLDLRLKLGGDGAGGDFFQERSLRSSEVSTEFGFPFGNLIDGYGVKLEKICVNVESKKEQDIKLTRPLTPA